MLTRLLERIMQMVLQNAGAQRGFLIMKEGQQLGIMLDLWELVNATYRMHWPWIIALHDQSMRVDDVSLIRSNLIETSRSFQRRCS